MSNIYEEFGATNVVLGSNEHDQSMLEQDVTVRDGDTSITLSQPEEGAAGDEPEVDEPEVDEPETDEPEPEGDEPEGDEPEGGEPEGDEPEAFEPLGAVPADVTEAQSELASSQAAFQSMVADAVARGLPQESVARIMSEHDGEGITEASFAELAKAGYSKQFVESYIKGQDAVAQRYVASITEYAGGVDKFNAILSHLNATDPESGDALIDAIQRQDVKSIKAIINLGMASRGKKFGKPAERTVTTQAKPAKATTVKAEGFASRDEMVKAMSDPRYSRDAKYRASVEQKVFHSQF